MLRATIFRPVHAIASALLRVRGNGENKDDPPATARRSDPPRDPPGALRVLPTRALLRSLCATLYLFRNPFGASFLKTVYLGNSQSDHSRNLLASSRARSIPPIQSPSALDSRIAFSTG